MRRGLEIRLLNYFLLITIAAMMIGIEFFFEMNRAGLIAGICGIDAQTALSEPLLHLRNKIVIMFGVLTLVVAIVMMMFIRNITWPLQHMVDVAERINSGDLSQSVIIRSRDELGQLGIAINDLTSNLQEMAVFTATASMAIRARVDAIAACSEQPEVLEELQAITLDLDSLRAFVSLFDTGQSEPS